MTLSFETTLQKRLSEKDILLMTHIVLGYPSWETCFQVVENMVEAGVDLMELQIPFSEPMADGPVILKANQKALEQGVSVKDCLDFAQEVAGRFTIPFFIMSYYNILFNGSSCLSVGNLISLNQHNMASDKGKRAFKGVRKTV